MIHNYIMVIFFHEQKRKYVLAIEVHYNICDHTFVCMFVLKRLDFKVFKVSLLYVVRENK